MTKILNRIYRVESCLGCDTLLVSRPSERGSGLEVQTVSIGDWHQSLESDTRKQAHSELGALCLGIDVEIQFENPSKASKVIRITDDLDVVSEMKKFIDEIKGAS